MDALICVLAQAAQEAEAAKRAGKKGKKAKKSGSDGVGRGNASFTLKCKQCLWAAYDSDLVFGG
eukprot:scaffold269772_cov17-Tisochrysis_lutea.AAC.1